MVMTLAFSTQFPKSKPELEGKRTRFVERILESMSVFNLTTFESWNEKVNQLEKMDLFDCDFLYNDPDPKIHTLRHDTSDKWKEGNDIHFVINNRMPNRFQFAPVVKCSGIQKIIINPKQRFVEYDGFELVSSPIKIDNRYLKATEIKQFAINDGFDSVDDFFAWFDEDFTGKIIHWTNFKY